MSKEKIYEDVPTHIEDVLLRKERGIEIDILKKTVEEFFAASKLYAEIKSGIDTLTDAKTIPRKKILDIVQATKGLRGVVLKKENRVITVYPSEEVTWVRDLLKESLEISYPAFVRETLVVFLRIPLGYETEKGIVISEEVMEKAIKKALLDLGISSEETLAKIMTQQVYIDVNEEELNEAIAQDRVKLQPGTRKAKVTWNIRVDLLRKFESVKV